LAGRTPAGAVQQYFGPLQQALSWVTEAVLRVSTSALSSRVGFRRDCERTDEPACFVMSGRAADWFRQAEADLRHARRAS